MYKEEPITNVEWIEVDQLNANDYNPNVVLNKELKLLELSLMTNGWIQPILINKDKTIIDGFHRSYLSKSSKLVKEKYKGKVPCVVMDLSEAERMLLTIRINRAKGNHVAFKMHSIVKKLIDEHKVDKKYIQESIGASKDEVELLYKDGVFDALNIKEHKYSRAWKSPKTT